MSKLKKVVVEIKGQDVELSVDEARELFNSLRGMFDSPYPYIPFSPPIPCDQTWPQVWYRDGTGELIPLEYDAAGRAICGSTDTS